MKALEATTELLHKSNLPRVIIVGGGFAGLELALKIDPRRYQVVMIDRHNYHTFQPLLYQVATSALEPDSISQPLRKVFDSKKNFYFRMANVLSVDTTARKLHTDIGDLDYDFLVVATGTKTNYFGNDALRTATFPLKQIPHALDLRSHLLQSFEAALLEPNDEARQALMNVVIVGGGPTGVELGGALSELRSHVLPRDYPELDFNLMQIYLVEGSPRLLNGMTEKSGLRALQYLTDFGVHVQLNTVVTHIEGNEVHLKDGTTLKSQNVIWSAGVTGNLFPGFDPAVVTKTNRLLVDGYNRVRGMENVFALGDIAAMESVDLPKGHPQLAPVAIQQGQLLGENLNAFAGGVEMKPFKYFNKGSMATVGRNKAVVDLPNNWSFGGFIAWLAWMFIHILYLVGFRNRAVVLTNWIYNYFTYDRSTRLIIRPYIKNRQAPAPEGVPAPPVPNPAEAVLAERS